MPRLTSRDYLLQRQYLVEEWLEHGAGSFGLLPYRHQIDLHDFYAPAEPMTDLEATRHRAAMTKAFPSLPQKAGRAYQALQDAASGLPNQLVDARRAATTSVTKIGGRPHSIRVAGIARPKPDHYQLARLLLNLAKQDNADELYELAKKMAKRRSR